MCRELLLHCCCALSRYHRSSLTLSLTYTHSLTHLLTHTLTHSLTHSILTRSRRPLTHDERRRLPALRRCDHARVGPQLLPVHGPHQPHGAVAAVPGPKKRTCEHRELSVEDLSAPLVCRPGALPAVQEAVTERRERGGHRSTGQHREGTQREGLQHHQVGGVVRSGGAAAARAIGALPQLHDSALRAGCRLLPAASWSRLQ